MKNEEIQYRTAPVPLSAEPINQRAKDGAGLVLSGYAAVFNETTSLGRFDEMVLPEAFREADLSDVRFLVDHTGVPLGRTASGTMQLETDARGLRYVVNLPDTARGRELYEAVRRGDVSQSSFAFIIEKESWNETNGRLVRSIEKIQTVLDASAVTFPAYANTSVSVGRF